MSPRKPEIPQKYGVIQDQALWQQIAMTVKPLEKRKKNKSTAIRHNAKKREVTQDKTSGTARGYSKPPPPTGHHAKTRPTQLDKATRQKVATRKTEIEATLDLHGMTLDQAFRTLGRFITRAYAAEKRTVLVITGKGAVGKRDTLRGLLPQWLEHDDIGGYVSGFSPASTVHGGTGAWYLRLRKHKPPAKK